MLVSLIPGGQSPFVGSAINTSIAVYKFFGLSAWAAGLCTWPRSRLFRNGSGAQTGGTQAANVKVDGQLLAYAEISNRQTYSHDHHDHHDPHHGIMIFMVIVIMVIVLNAIVMASMIIVSWVLLMPRTAQKALSRALKANCNHSCQSLNAHSSQERPVKTDGQRLRTDGMARGPRILTHAHVPVYPSRTFGKGNHRLLYQLHLLRLAETQTPAAADRALSRSVKDAKEPYYNPLQLFAGEQKESKSVGWLPGTTRTTLKATTKDLLVLLLRYCAAPMQERYELCRATTICAGIFDRGRGEMQYQNREKGSHA